MKLCDHSDVVMDGCIYCKYEELRQTLGLRTLQCEMLKTDLKELNAECDSWRTRHLVVARQVDDMRALAKDAFTDWVEDSPDECASMLTLGIFLGILKGGK
jgi:hypothetical protein